MPHDTNNSLGQHMRNNIIPLDWSTHLQHIDGLTPTKRIEALLTYSDSEQIREVVHKIILLLAVIDEAFEKNFGAKSLYVMDTGMILQWIQRQSFISPKIYLEGLILLDESDLIFRFTCAKKFQIKDQTLKQLRINSWGKTYAADIKRGYAFDDFLTSLTKLCNETLSVHVNDYEHLISLLKLPISLASSQQIADINKKVPIQLLS